MLRARTQPVARAPSADAQLSSLVVGHKPVVRLLLLRSADVARYRLPDHRISPSPHSLSAAHAIPCFSALAVAPADADPAIRAATDWSSLWNRSPLFHRVSGGIDETRMRESDAVSNPNRKRNRPETERSPARLRLRMLRVNTKRDMQAAALFTAIEMALRTASDRFERCRSATARGAK